ncbi:MAG: RluA family pseudouridine synthase [Candidatus Izemoplasmatales bacterium]|jgi:23S rRNA pseudouridine1911/1915/1917 synthase
MSRPEFEEALEYVVTSTDELERLDKFVAKIYPQYSRTLVQKAIDEKMLEVNGKYVNSHYIVRPNDIIVFMDVPIAEMNLTAENIPLSIIYEDDDVLVVDKPTGMVVHPAPGSYEHTLVNALLYHINSLSSINGNIRPGIVHRIDKDTSGLLMVAKNDYAHMILAEELAKKVTKREYIALVDGIIANEKGTIDMPIGRDFSDRKRMAVIDNGKKAITHFIVLERFTNNTLVKCVLETGRTHQIRVHMAKIGYPVTNDPVYNKHHIDDNHGQYLHAATIGFTHPSTKVFMEFSTPLPDYFAQYLDNIRKH